MMAKQAVENYQLTMEDRKDALLKRLWDGKNGRFKRYKNGLPIAYPGGKSFAVGQIISRMPRNVKKIVSPFFGGGSVEFACAKELDISVKGYDIFDILINYWQVQLSMPETLAARLEKNHPMTVERFAENKDNLARHYLGMKEITDRVELAASYYLNFMCSFGPQFLGYWSEQRVERYQKGVERVRDFKCRGVTVTEMDFTMSIKNHANDFLFCDPPYFLSSSSSVFRPMYPSTNHPVHHKDFDHEKLAELLLSHGGNFILTYNDCEEVRDLYRDMKLEEVGWYYSFNTRDRRDKKRTELIITNY